jgi:ABC-type antimicrobial peptide transport system permease subunit
VIAGVLREALMVVLGGLIVGIPTVFAASRVLRTLLFGITATDLPTLAGGVMLLVATAVIAASVPAWRASRVDPVVALRQD